MSSATPQDSQIQQLVERMARRAAAAVSDQAAEMGVQLALAREGLDQQAAALAQKDEQLEEQGRQLAEKDAELARLRATNEQLTRALAAQPPPTADPVATPAD